MSRAAHPPMNDPAYAVSVNAARDDRRERQRAIKTEPSIRWRINSSIFKFRGAHAAEAIHAQPAVNPTWT